MKKLILLALFFGMMSNGVNAQNGSDFTRGVFNHVSMNVGVGTEGISVGVAAPVTNYLDVEVGADFMPGIKVDGDLNVKVSNPITVEGQSITLPNTKVNVEGNFARTQFHFKANVYPFGGNNGLFVAAGFSFGGNKIAKIKGHSDDLKGYMETYPQQKDQILDAISAQLGDYQIRFDDDANISGDVRCNGFRPYVGLGFGRQIPKSRLGFRVEAGCQFMGHLKVYQNDEQIDLTKALQDNGADDNLSKFVDNWTVYPVLKFSLVGRLL